MKEITNIEELIWKRLYERAKAEHSQRLHQQWLEDNPNISVSDLKEGVENALERITDNMFDRATMDCDEEDYAKILDWL